MSLIYLSSKNMETKVCHNCKIEYPINKFRLLKSRRDGRDFKCTDCRLQFNQNKYQREKEKLEENKEKIKKENENWEIVVYLQCERKMAGEQVYNLLNSLDEESYSNLKQEAIAIRGNKCNRCKKEKLLSDFKVGNKYLKKCDDCRSDTH